MGLGLGQAGDNYGVLEAGKLVFHASSANTMEHTQVGRGDGDEDGVEHGLDWVGVRVAVGVGFSLWGMAPTHDNLQQIVASRESIEGGGRKKKNLLQ